MYSVNVNKKQNLNLKKGGNKTESTEKGVQTDKIENRDMEICSNTHKVSNRHTMFHLFD